LEFVKDMPSPINPARADLDDLHLFLGDGAIVRARRLKVNNENHAARSSVTSLRPSNAHLPKEWGE